MEKCTLNPFANAKRTAQGTGGGVSPAVIEEMQEEISILGSQNETQAQDIADIKTALEGLAGAITPYSTDEQATGVKWTDGKMIYKKTWSGLNIYLTSNATKILDFAIEKLIKFEALADWSMASKPLFPSIYKDGNTIKGTGSNEGLDTLTLYYTKATV